MRNFIVEEQKYNTVDGKFYVVVEGETHINRTKITCDLMQYCLEGGYDYNHPYRRARGMAETIADSLNKYFGNNSNEKNKETD